VAAEIADEDPIELLSVMPGRPTTAARGASGLRSVTLAPVDRGRRGPFDFDSQIWHGRV